MSRGRGCLPLAATIVVAATASHAGCLDRPDVEELLAEPVIATRRAPGVDFAAPATFAMADTIPVDDSLDGGTSSRNVDPAIAKPTLDEIARQLTSRGYRQIDRTERPDLGVAVTAVVKLHAATVNYGSWWGGGGATTGFWGYPGGFSSAIGYSTIAWQSGTLIIDLFDLRAARDQTPPGVALGAAPVTIPALWGAFIHGVIGGQATLTAPPIGAVQQAFIQSPYLTRSKQ